MNPFFMLKTSFNHYWLIKEEKIHHFIIVAEDIILNFFVFLGIWTGGRGVCSC